MWLNLAGWCLRPGYGDALDPWRIEQLWAMFDSGVQHHKDSQVCAEWWTLWRRVTGGLDATAQLRLLDDFAFNLQADAGQRGSRPVTLVNGSTTTCCAWAPRWNASPAATRPKWAPGC